MSFSIWWLQRHEAAIREREQARERRRMQPLMAVNAVVWSDDFEGCTE